MPDVPHSDRHGETPADNLTRAEARARAALIGGVDYAITLDISQSATAPAFSTTTEITFSSAEAAPTFLNLVAEQVHSVVLNGVDLGPDAHANHRIHLADVHEGTNQVRVVAECAFGHTGVGLHRAIDPIDGEVYLYTHAEPFDAHRWFACFDQPDIKGSYSIATTAPAHWSVISNAMVDATSPADEGRTLTRFRRTPMISTYLAAIVAGPYHRVTDRHGPIELAIYCRRSLAAHLDHEEFFDLTKQGLDYFSTLFRIPYPFGKYDQLLVPEFNWGAMEHPGCVTFNEAFIYRSRVTEGTRSRRANVILHEMAHMWFGNLVTMRWWDDLWLNESFATFMATFASVNATRFTDVWVDFANLTKANAARQDQLPSTHPISADIVDTEAVRLNFDGITYAKGAAVLRQLVAWVGEDALFTGVRAYFDDHAWGNAELRDFLRALEKASGRDLDGWIKEWIQTSGMSILKPVVSSTAGTYTSVALVQEGTGPTPTLRSHRIAVGLYNRGAGGRLERTRRVELDVVGASTAIPELAGERVPALLLVNDDDLTFAKVRFDKTSLNTVIDALSDIDDPLARALCWAQSWDMTRDAELPTRDFVALVARHAPAETSIAMLERIIAQVVTAVDTYSDPANRAAVRATLAAASRTALDAAEPGSDLQLAWARSLIASADDGDNLALLLATLDGERHIEGLAVDTDLRWLIVQRLSAGGHINRSRIDAEAEIDPSDIGQRRAACAAASAPWAEAKAQAWRMATEEWGHPLQMLGAIVAGFDQPDQDDLTHPYLERYEAGVTTWWGGRSRDEAHALTEGLFPHYRIGPEVVAVADRLLANPDLPGPARRIIAEQRDMTMRTRRARAADRGAQASPAR